MNHLPVLCTMFNIMWALKQFKGSMLPTSIQIWDNFYWGVKLNNISVSVDKQHFTEKNTKIYLMWASMELCIYSL